MPPQARSLRLDPGDLMQIVRLLPDVLFRCYKGEDGQIYWSLNEGGLAEEFGLTTEQIRGKTLHELFPGGASPELEAHFEDAFRGKPTIFTNEIAGRHFRHYPQPVRDEDGNVEAVVGYIAEVTDLVKTQEKLAQANLELQTFAHAISHDLQNPLMTLVALVQILARRGDDYDEKTRHILERMERTVHRMQYISEDILYLSQVSRDGLERTDVDVTAIVHTIRRGLEATATKRNVAWDVQEGMRIDADERLCRIVFENVLGNAWKYTADAEQPGISVRQEEGGDGRRWVVVEDNGTGFAPADAKRIFQPFERAHAGRVGGTGVGLSTVKRIVDRHGGDVRAEGRPGEGATVRFTLDSEPAE